jgi:hypothetical protein
MERAETKMKKKLAMFQLLALWLSLSLCTIAQAQGPSAQPKRIAVRAARMLNVRSGNVVNNAVVIVENGRIQAAGKFADLIAVAGDPLKEIGELENVRFVMKGGAIVKDELRASGAATTAGSPSK